MKLKTPDLFFSPKVLILKDEATKTEQYEVYYVFHTETKDLLYIGSGKKDRHKHVFSGASQNISLNTCTICPVPMTVVVKGVASKEESYSSHEAAIYKKFKIGQSYSSKDIKDTLTELGIEEAKGTSINRWFDTVRGQVNGKEGYRIVRKL